MSESLENVLTADIGFGYSPGSMTPETFRAELDALGIQRQVDIAAALGVGQSTVSSWLNGESRIPPMVRLALKAIPRRSTVQDTPQRRNGRSRKSRKNKP